VWLGPDNPADPETAALELIVRVPAEVLGHDSPLRDVLEDFASLLHAESAFAGMSWHDARHAASAIMVEALHRDDATQSLLSRAERVRDRSDGMTWDDREAMARALRIGATVLGL
jgi:hypothetical protein